MTSATNRIEGRSVFEYNARRHLRSRPMAGIDEVVGRIIERRSRGTENRSLLVGISGIDGCGKGYVAGQIEAHLAQRAVASAVINIDGWLNLPDKRFDPTAP